MIRVLPGKKNTDNVVYQNNLDYDGCATYVAVDKSDHRVYLLTRCCLGGNFYLQDLDMIRNGYTWGSEGWSSFEGCVDSILNTLNETGLNLFAFNSFGELCKAHTSGELYD